LQLIVNIQVVSIQNQRASLFQEESHRMSFLKRSRKHRQNTPIAAIESLEERVLLSNVTVSIDDGTLNVRGDDGDNKVNVVMQSPFYHDYGYPSYVQSFNGTTINGEDRIGLFAANSPCIPNLVCFSVDRSGPNPCSLARDLIINGGNGNDTIWVFGANLGHNLTINGGRGDDSVQLRSTSTENNLRIFTHSGNDRVNILRGSLAGNQFLLNTGSGDDAVLLKWLEVPGRTSIATGSGEDQVNIFRAEFSDRLSINTGRGDDKIQIKASEIDAAFAIYSGSGSDNIRVLDTEMTGTGRIDAGRGDDNVRFVDSTTTDDLSISGGGGTDTLDFFRSHGMFDSIRARYFENGDFAELL